MRTSMQGRKLRRIPEKGMIKGVCAGIANYFDVPVKLVRAIAVLAFFLGFAFFIVVAYIALTFILEPMPAESLEQQSVPDTEELLTRADRQLAASKQRLRDIERYVTSDTFTLRSQFRKL